ncbi:hypothetical protein D5086_025861 [Populus alba]|uniref:Uncharacterized protein n=1 Tax=Populus alba TaxID=43335 RepID=A0ACC4B188_POPAL
MIGSSCDVGAGPEEAMGSERDRFFSCIVCKAAACPYYGVVRWSDREWGLTGTTTSGLDYLEFLLYTIEYDGNGGAQIPPQVHP